MMDTFAQLVNTGSSKPDDAEEKSNEVTADTQIETKNETVTLKKPKKKKEAIDETTATPKDEA